ncbi:DNA polymerase I [Oleidesulfovibrio alaskensis]|jgi:DNA polymerase-1|uniref:DNA polymerase I n=1 Tax=Oleidesulfovibrio alaskensis TaxID=58180 RepID=UPI001A3F1C3F|nr:DNA polymerase I [Oleidesulfovibrio alaskensis]MBL3580896.1 DNA polymerase I [Oleidesulfovibrio alaskensis]
MSLKERLGLDKEPVYLIDGSAFIFRGFYAFQNMQRSDGLPTNALFIVLRILLKLLREEQPAYAAFFMDGKGPTFRHALYDQYKANRSATPEPLVQQLDPIRRGVRSLGIPLEVSDGCEADDCIASLAAKFKSERPVIIVGADKDLKQCIDDNVYLWDPGAKQEKLLDLAGFTEETGLSPSQWPDFQAVIGDSSDNIPGVPGVGPKTAAQIFAEFPTLEAIQENEKALKPGVQKKFAGQWDNIYLYRRLTTLDTGRCTSLALKDMTVQSVDADNAAAFLREFELRTLLRELPQSVPVRPARSGAAAMQQASLFGEPQAAPQIPSFSSADQLPAVSGTVALVPAEKGIAVAVNGNEYLYTGKPEDLAAHMAQTGAISRIIAPDVKALYRSHTSWRAIEVHRWFDLGLAAYLLNPEERDYSWTSLARRAEEFGIDAQTPATLALTLAQDAAARLEGVGLSALMEELEMPLIPVLADMELRGIRINRAEFSGFLAEVQKELDRLTQEVYAVAGGQFNIRSSQQLGELLFGTLGLKAGSKTKGGQASTSQAVLEKLAGKHPVIDTILEYRKLEKLRSTYLEPLPRLAQENDRIHTTFNQLATATGRLSSSQPNLQNIPVRGPMGQRMRRCFTAAPGNKLVAADYSQIELRVLAHVSADPTLIESFTRNEDIHSRTAGLLYDVTAADVTPDQRRNAKTINFGLIYGMGPQKLAQELKVTLNEAKEFIERYFSKLSHLKEFYDNVEQSAREHGFVTTLAGRRRLLPEIHSDNNQLRSQARRQAINTVVQGSAADIIKIAMLKAAADETLQQLNAALILQVHDELLLEAPQDVAEAAAKRLADIMSSVRPGGAALDVPLAVDYGIGDNWGQAH